MENDNGSSIQRMMMEISRMYMEKCFGKLKNLGIHPRQMPILAVLWRGDGCSQKELAKELGVKPPTVTVSIQRLEKAGIIIRKQDEKDQRVSRIYLSEEGRSIIKEGMRMAKEGEQQLLAGFSESELCLMRRFCVQIKENIKAMPGSDISPDDLPLKHFCHRENKNKI
ncbi:MAG: MarR family transcriptional regulator [Clostridia bacterium]|nr:MarR family transcriptional regulator [Clostridia bacterium]